jgi:hypothetical protein
MCDTIIIPHIPDEWLKSSFGERGFADNIRKQTLHPSIAVGSVIRLQRRYALVVVLFNLLALFQSDGFLESF